MRSIIVTAIAVLLLSVACSSATANGRKIVVVVAHGAMLEDIAADDLPNFHWLFANGATAVMTTRAAGDPATNEKSETSTEAACLTLGAGSRAFGGIEARLAYNADEDLKKTKASMIYRRLFLKTPPPYSVVVLSANEIAANNAGLQYRIRPGLLGDTLHKAGLLTACVGNSDTIERIHRESATICMDSHGVIDFGDVSQKTLRRDPTAPYGVKTSIPALVQVFKEILNKADLIVVDTGDFARADWYADKCMEAQSKALRLRAAQRLDDAMGAIADCLDLRSSRLIFVAPGQSRWKPNRSRKLAPILMVGEGVKHGLLASPSTRKVGLITNTDLAPDILAYFGLPIPELMVGRPLSSAAQSNPTDALLGLDRSLTLQNNSLALMRVLAYILSGLVILGILIRSKPAIATRLALIAAMIAPLAALLPIFGPRDVLTNSAILALMIAVTMVILSMFRLEADEALMWIAAALCVIIAADLGRGGIWLSASPFSYSPAEAARFYGLGNEMTGSLLGAAAIVILAAIEPTASKMRVVRRIRILICLACFVGLAFLIGAPNLGADTGGALAALAAAGATLAILASGSMNRRGWLIASIVPIAILALLVVLDRVRGAGEETHFARALGAIGSGHAADFGLTIVRKVGMNLKLLGSSPWSKLLFVCAGALIYLKAVGWSSSRNQGLRRTTKVITVSALAAFVFNDSGVVAAATCLIYAWSAELIGGKYDGTGGTTKLRPSE